MTIIRFFTDPHEGRELKANTTPASRALLAEQLHLYAMQAVSMPHPEDKKVAATICGGDLFDTDSNPEHVLLRGAELASKCDIIVGGNHDVTNIKGRSSTLGALDKLLSGNRFVMPPEPGNFRTHHAEIGDVLVVTVPHHARQQEFERALGEAQKASEESLAKRKILLVHCNYHLTFETGENDLNLTDAKARHLLKGFDYIVMGHDHRPRRECEGRVIILGNTHPTSFSDLGEKFVWFYDSESNEWEQVQNAADGYFCITPTELLDMKDYSRLREVEWLDIAGTIDPEAAVDMARAMRQIWKEAPYMYAVRASKVRYKAEGETDLQPVAAQKTLVEIIREQLASSPELLALFDEAQTMED